MHVGVKDSVGFGIEEDSSHAMYIYWLNIHRLTGHSDIWCLKKLKCQLATVVFISVYN